MAADAFYMRRCLEGDRVKPFAFPIWSAAFWAQLLRLAGDRALRHIAGYGVRPWRMLWWLIMPPLLATLLFVAVPGAAMPPQPADASAPHACDAQAPVADAAALSGAIYGSFDPALVTTWRVSGCQIAKTPVTAWHLANVERIIGWFLIPLALLTFTGVLARLLGYRS